MSEASHDPIRLEVFKNLFAGIAEEMGVVLRKAAYSPNIKERRDYSCAVFNERGELISQAAHIPVHLGSMPLSVSAVLEKVARDHAQLSPGDVYILNDPFRGGTHLPDITLVSPVFIDEVSSTRPYAFVANRAHHSDVGGMMPGSMPVAREIFQEGLIIPPIKLIDHGNMNEAVIDLVLANVRTPDERRGDLFAQMAANRRGAIRLNEMLLRYGSATVSDYMGGLVAYTERMMRHSLQLLPDGVYSFVDYMDDDGLGHSHIPIQVAVTIEGDTAIVDFTGSASQQEGSINAVLAITMSAVYYVFRCLVGLDIPNNHGCMAPITIIAPERSIVNASMPAPVAGGNVETSQRIVDVLLGALAQAAPEKVPAASQGTMNNVTIGGWDERHHVAFAYYETIGGGMGARPDCHGVDAIHTHMTNTLNTPVEALEYAYPLRVERYEIRDGSGGEGHYHGGCGIRRDVRVLADAQVSLLTERRQSQPYGLAGGSPGLQGANTLIRGDREEPLPAKGTIYLQADDILSICTPGGGGYGKPDG
ncbi:MAG TPA: hydantoinase B/oxoprolinase family protein [Anaerolineae bacterium]|jgi:N-methylhydantoinase B